MAEITAQLVKQLRERTGAGMMECKSALVEANGDIGEAEVVLRKRGIASAGKKSSRTTKQGLIGSYIHAGAQLGVLVEVNCESDFVARTEDFQELVHDLAMHIAAADPQFISQRRRAAPRRSKKSTKSSAPARCLKASREKVVEKIVEGRMAKVLRRGLPARAALRQREHPDRRPVDQDQDRQTRARTSRFRGSPGSRWATWLPWKPAAKGRPTPVPRYKRDSA